MEIIEVNGKKYTNKHNLPPEIIAALCKDRYITEGEEPSDYSASSLSAPVQQTILKRRYPDDYVIRDITDSFYAFLGSVSHSVLEEAWHESMGGFIEDRLYAEVLGKSLSGKPDGYRCGEIRDYKSTKAYKIIKGDHTDWEIQTNIYAYLCRKNGHSVNRLVIYAFIFDWKAGETYKNGYPASPIVEIPLRLWSEEEQYSYIYDRIQLLIEAEATEDSKLIECSEKECWTSELGFARMKVGVKRAIKIHSTLEEAQAALKKGEYIQRRTTPRIRCRDYCSCANICHQNKRLTLEENGGTIGEESTEEPIF
jgi:hypothetical protein